MAWRCIFFPNKPVLSLVRQKTGERRGTIVSRAIHKPSRIRNGVNLSLYSTMFGVLFCTCCRSATSSKLSDNHLGLSGQVLDGWLSIRKKP